MHYSIPTSTCTTISPPRHLKELAMKKNETHDTNPAHSGIVSNRILRVLLLGLGHVSVGLGVIGIFLPLLPTTPFLLLAAWCYSKSSERFHSWLLTNKWFGDYIRNYQEGKGIPLKTKLYAISFLWATILFSAFFIVHNLLVRVVLLVIAAVVSCHILMIKTFRKDGDS